MDEMKQPNTFETLMRHWNMLQMLPRWPRKISTPEVHQRLADRGFTTTNRTVQRDLDKLSGYFQIYGDDHKPRGWCWAKDARILDLPSMDPQTALTLHLVAEYSRQVLPPSTLRHLKPHFELAEKTLKGLSESSLTKWLDKIRVIQSGPIRIPPKINPEALDVIYTALLDGKRFHASYRPRNSRNYKDHQINPLGLVFKDGLGYLVCTINEYSDPRQLSLHRFRSAEISDEPSTTPTKFSLDEYIASGEFNYSDGEQIKLRILLQPWIVRLFSELPMSKDQKLAEQDDGRILLEATVAGGDELRWWLLSHGSGIEVLEPEELRENMRKEAQAIFDIYS
jgi:predicted DNA-binding transcriptional regulator YafY